MEYIKVPHEIEERSMEIIVGLLPELAQLPEGEANIIKRVVHTTGDPDIAPLVKIHPLAVSTGLKALQEGCTVITDVNMVKSGINARNLTTLGGKLECYINHPDVIARAKDTGNTRAIEAVIYALNEMNGGIVAIGNAPTALFTLCEYIRAGTVKPALVIGCPVGFVGAKESKEYLIDTDIPYITIQGTKGGSTVAAAVVNALLYTNNNNRYI